MERVISLRFFRWWLMALALAGQLAWGQTTPTITFAPAPYLFLGQTMSFTLTLSVRGTYDGQWFKDGQPLDGPIRYINLSSLTLRIGPVQASHAGEYWLQLRTSDGVTVTSPRVRFSVVEAIRITEHPQGARVNVGSSTTLSGAATGPGTITYQWYLTDFDYSGAQPISGATSRTLTVANDPANAYDWAYFLEAKNEYHAVRSNLARIEVLRPPTILQQPRVSRSSTEGAFIFDAGNQGGTRPLTYAWSKNGTPLQITSRMQLYSDWGTLVISEASEADSGDYRLIVTNAYGTATSEPVRFIFTAAPKLLPIGIWNMRPQEVESGATVTFIVGATGTPPPTYQWHFDGRPIAGETGTTLRLTNVTRAAHQGSYSVVVTNSEGRVISPSVHLSVTLPPEPPTIQGLSPSATVDAGRQLSLGVSAMGAPPLSYQWYFNGTALPGATGTLFNLDSIKMSEAGAYTVKVSNAIGSVTSQPIVLTVIAPSQAPVITQQPEDKVANVGALVTFHVGATATGLEYQWRKDGVTIPGATLFAYSISPVQASHAGSYSVEVWNSVGRAFSRSASLAVGTSFPEILRQPIDQRASAGFRAELAVEARGEGLAYQWDRNGTDIPGATAATLVFPVVQVSDSGLYRVTVRNASGQVRSNQVSLTVSPSAEPIPPTRLANLSVRARLASASEVLIVGFVYGGAGGSYFLLRGVGPGLRQFGVEGAAEATAVSLYRGSSLILRETSWFPEWQQGVFPRVGAFPLPVGSREGVIWLQTDLGAYTAHVEATAGPGGDVLAEVYDMNPQGYPGRFLNLSARGRAGGGTSLIAGFVVTGSGTHTVIVRGVGPTLTDLGVTDAIAQPQLTLRRTEAAGSTLIASNAAWDATLATAFTRAGAFQLRANSRDAALMLPLAPGAYTAELVNGATATGTALIEVYDAR